VSVIAHAWIAHGLCDRLQIPRVVRYDDLEVPKALRERALDRIPQPGRPAERANADRDRGNVRAIPAHAHRGSMPSPPTRAGTPWTCARSATSRVTTEPAPTSDPCPIVRSSRTIAPIPMYAPSCTVTRP